MKYFNIKDGKLICKKENEVLDSYSGVISSIKEFESTFDGKKIKQVYVNFPNDVVITFNKNSWFSWSFFNSVTEINLKNEVKITPNKAADSKITFCNLEQSGTRIKKGSTIPKPEKLEINGMKMSNWDGPGYKMTDLINKFSMNGFVPEAKKSDLPF